MLTDQIVSHFKILEKLGEGGMGEVYLAEDSKLERKVALKFLPAHYTADPQVNARFQREARAAAALNHPNIITVYEVGKHEGRAYIAMEYVDGKSLRETLEKEQLPFECIIDILSQICEGLAKAHAAGIVHRDLKPENIMLDADGKVRILDFGLARMKGASKLTSEASTFGTVYYMSPEQCQGEKVDRRADIWAVGVMLYEMLTGGRLPFEGEHQHVVMYSIMAEEPEPLKSHVTGVSENLQTIIDNALSKDRDARYQHIDDLLADLKHVNDTTLGSTKPAALLRAIHPAKKKMLSSLTAVVILIIVITGLLLLKQHSRTLNPDATFRTLSIPFSEISYPGLSQDGNWVVFGAADANRKWDVYIMNTSRGNPRRVTSSDSGLAEIDYAQLSPDGGQIVYEHFNPKSFKYELHIVSSLGGRSKKLVEKAAAPRWRPDGQRIGYIFAPSAELAGKHGKKELWSIMPDGSDNRLEFKDTIGAEDPMISFSWSPDGKSIAWLRSYEEGHHEVILRELASGKERQLTFDKKEITEVLWTYQNEIIFSSNKGGTSNLWLVPIEGDEAVAITKGAESVSGPQISADGEKLVYLQQNPIGYIWVTNRDGNSARQITFEERWLVAPRLSPDANRLLFTMGEFGQTYWHLYIMDRDGKNRQQLTSGNVMIFDHAWSRDGHWISYSSARNFIDSANVYLLAGANQTMPRLLGRGWRTWWADSNTLIISRGQLPELQNWAFYLDEKPPQKIYEDSTLVFPFPQEKYMVFRDYRKGQEGWWITPISGLETPATTPPRKLLPEARAIVAPNGKFILYYEAELREIRKISLPDGKDQVFPVPIPEMYFESLGISYSGEEISYTDLHLKGKLMIIENPFR